MKSLCRIILPLCLLSCASCQILEINSPSQRLAEAEDEIRQSQSDYWKLFPLGQAAMASVDTGDYEKAQRYANELLRLSHDLFPGQEPDADGIHKGNIVLGRLALRSGNVAQAKFYLLESAKVTGSPVLKSFGPNMILAEEMLKKGESKAVLEYFDLCARFWKRGQDKLSEWKAKVEGGGIPDFGANEDY